MSTNTSINPTHAKTQFADDLRVIAAAEVQGCISVDKVDGFPESLKYLDKMLPGLLFWHHSPDGEKIPQYRPDNPGKDKPKYIFPKGSGSVLSVNPTMTLDRPIVAIVEGTKQSLFAAAYAPDDVLVVGIQGCWGWSYEGQALSSLDGLVEGRDVVVIFDADVSSNPDVYAAGASLLETLEIIRATSVKFASIPGSKSVGLDDFLTRRPEAKRGEVFAEIIAKAVPFSKIKKPAKRKVTVDPKNSTFNYVSTSLGEICAVEFEQRDDDGIISREQEARSVAGEVDGRIVRRADTLLYGAVTVDTLVTSLDDLTTGVEPSYAYDLTLQIGPKGESQEYKILNVADPDLGNPRKWLARAGEAGLMTELGPNGIGAIGGLRISEAIRADMKTREFKRRVIRSHSGWFKHDDESMFSDNKGSHTATRKRDDVNANLEGSLSALDIPGYHENYEPRDVYHALDQLFEVEGYLYDATPWVAGLSALMWSLSGGDPEAVLYILGGEGSGKTSIAGLITSFLSKDWGTGLNPMASADGSAAYLRDLTKQPHNMLLVVDDIRGRSTGRAQDTQADGLENLIRPAYGGGGAGTAKKVRNANGDWVQEKSKHNRFFLCIVGEVLPEAERQSSIERCLVVEVDRDTSLKPMGTTPNGLSGHEHFTQLCRKSTFMPITSCYLMSMAKIIDEAGGIDEWRKMLSEERTKITASAVATRVLNTTPRVHKVSGTFVSGATMFIEWCQEIGYFDPETYEKATGKAPKYLRSSETILNHWHDLIIKATKRHSVVNLNSEGAGASMLSELKDLVASGRYNIGDIEIGKTRIGVRTEVLIDGAKVKCVALLPHIVEKALERQIDYASLKKLLIPDCDGKSTRVVRSSGLNSRCLVMRESDWELHEQKGP